MMYNHWLYSLESSNKRWLGNQILVLIYLGGGPPASFIIGVLILVAFSFCTWPELLDFLQLISHLCTTGLPAVVAKPISCLKSNLHTFFIACECIFFPVTSGFFSMTWVLWHYGSLTNACHSVFESCFGQTWVWASSLMIITLNSTLPSLRLPSHIFHHILWKSDWTM